LAQPLFHDHGVQPVGGAPLAGSLKFPLVSRFACAGLVMSRSAASSARMLKVAVPTLPVLAAFRLPLIWSCGGWLCCSFVEMEPSFLGNWRSILLHFVMCQLGDYRSLPYRDTTAIPLSRVARNRFRHCVALRAIWLHIATLSGRDSAGIPLSRGGARRLFGYSAGALGRRRPGYVMKLAAPLGLNESSVSIAEAREHVLGFSPARFPGLRASGLRPAHRGAADQRAGRPLAPGGPRPERGGGFPPGCSDGGATGLGGAILRPGRHRRHLRGKYQRPSSVPGDLIRVTGVSHPAGLPPSSRSRAGRNWHRAVAHAKAVSIEQLMAGLEDSQRVEITGTVRSARVDEYALVFHLVSGGYRFQAIVPRTR